MGDTALRAVVVGTGFGCRVHVPALRAAGFDVVGLVGRDTARLARRAQTCEVSRTFTDLDDAISQTRAAVVTIASPPHTHAEFALKAIASGCHVLCEKPMASDACQAKQMLDAAQAAGVVHLMGNEFRWQPDRALIQRALAAGAIGTPRLLTLTQYVPLLAPPDAKMPAWWFDIASGGGWLGASGSHLIDQIRNWIGEFASLSAALPMVSAREAGAEDTYVVRFRSAGGLEGVIQQTGGSWGPLATMTRIAGTRGTLWSDEGAVRVADSTGVRTLTVPEDLALPAIPTSGDISRQQMAQLELAPFKRLCEAFRAAIDGHDAPGSVAPPTFADGLACMIVIDAIRRSAAHDGAVQQLN